MTIQKRKFKCTGCGEERPCFLEVNQEANGMDFMMIDDLVCVLDHSNSTSFNWKRLLND